MAINYDDAGLQNPATRKGEFREIARDIVWKDRYSRKTGKSVDTAGAIASAMAQAYKLGMAHGNTASTSQTEGAPTNDAPTWNSIPRRAREVFAVIQQWGMPVQHRVASGYPMDKTDQWITYWDHGDQLPADRRFTVHQAYSVSTLAPLIKMGLMEEAKAGNGVLLVTTEKGKKTWRRAIQDGHVNAV